MRTKGHTLVCAFEVLLEHAQEPFRISRRGVEHGPFRDLARA